MATEREYLEKLIFEVHGAEEGQRKIDALIKKEEAHAKSMKGLSKQAKASAKEEADAAKMAARAQEERARATKDALTKSAAAFALLAAAAAKASADLETANGKVERSFKKAGATTNELGAALAKADEEARKFGIGLIAQREALSELIDATQDAAKASEALTLATDIAATGDVDRAKAVEMVAKAYKGEVEELKKLDGFTKENVEALGKIEDRATRAAVAVDILKESYSGAATELKDANTSLNNLKEAGNDLLAVVGDVGSGLISAMLRLAGVAGEGNDGFTRFATGMRNFAGAAAEASSYIGDLIDYRASLGTFDIATPAGFAEFVSQRDSERAIAAAGKGGGGGGGGNKPRDINPNDYNFLRYGPEKGGAAKKKGGKKKGDDGSGFLGDFGNGQKSLEEVAGEEAQALEEKLDRQRTFQENVVNLEREAAEERKRIAQDQDDFEEKLLTDKFLREKKAREQAEAAAWAGVDAAGQIAGAFIKDEGVKAVISGGIETARAIADGASGNIPGAIGHGAAAAQFFAVAAQAGAGGGKQHKGKFAGGGQNRGADMSRDREAVARIGSQGPQSNSMAPVVINISSTLTPHPEQARQLGEMLGAEVRRNTGGMLGQLRNPGGTYR